MRTDLGQLRIVEPAIGGESRNIWVKAEEGGDAAVGGLHPGLAELIQVPRFGVVLEPRRAALCCERPDRETRVPAPQCGDQADRETEAAAEVHDLRPAGERPARREAHILQEVVVPEPIALWRLAEESMQPVQRGRHPFQDLGWECAIV